MEGETLVTKRKVLLLCLDWYRAGHVETESVVTAGKMVPWDGVVACCNCLYDLGGLMGEW